MHVHEWVRTEACRKRRKCLSCCSAFFFQLAASHCESSEFGTIWKFPNHGDPFDVYDDRLVKVCGFHCVVCLSMWFAPTPHNHSFLMGHMSFCIAIDGLFRNYFGLFHIISGYFGVLSYWFLSYAPDKQTDLKMLPTPTIKMLPMPTDDIVSVGN